MKKSVLFGMAMFTLVLWGISIVPMYFLENGDRLFWQLSNWAWIFVSLFTAIVVVLLAIRYTKGKHILWRIMAWIGCTALVVSCLISFYIARAMHDEKIWSGKDYVVYSESEGFIDPNRFVLYKRDGLIDRRMYSMPGIGFGEVKGANYTMYNDFDLIKEEVDATEFESDSVYHRTLFFRLSDGYQFEQNKNDSLLNMIRY